MVTLRFVVAGPSACGALASTGVISGHGSRLHKRRAVAWNSLICIFRRMLGARLLIFTAAMAASQSAAVKVLKARKWIFVLQEIAAKKP